MLGVRSPLCITVFSFSVFTFRIRCEPFNALRSGRGPTNIDSWSVMVGWQGTPVINIIITDQIYAR